MNFKRLSVSLAGFADRKQAVLKSPTLALHGAVIPKLHKSYGQS